MGTSGKVARLLVAATLAVTGGCTTAPEPSPEVTPTAWPSSPAVDGMEQAFCSVPLPDSWQDALDAGRFPLEDGDRGGIIMVAPDGSLLVTSVVPGVRDELRWLAAGAGEHVVVQQYEPGDESWVLGATFDGRYLAYTVMNTNTLASDWTLYYWDSVAKGRPVEIATSERDSSGEVLPGPYNYPVVHDGMVAWVQVAAGTPDQTSLHVYRIADGGREVVSTGYGHAPFRMGSWLMWQDAPEAGVPTRLKAVSFDTGEPVVLPRPLVEIEGASFIDASDDTVTWIDSDGTELWVWRTGWEAAVQMASRPEDDDRMEWVHVAGEIVAWSGSLAQFALDLRTGSYTPLTPEWGSQTAGGPFLMVGFAPESRTSQADHTVVDTRELPPLPGCS